MPSSLILSGGAAGTRTIKETITQTNHGFTAGDVLRWDTTQSPHRYVKAKADTAANAEVVGVVNNYVGPDTFELTYSGVIDISKFAGISAAPVLFLSAVEGGSLGTMPPSTIGSVIKPILTKNKESSYIVNNFLGTQIGGSSTVAIDEIQPVGTIMPFAGSEIPTTWLPCDGSTYDRVEYSELYSKVCFTDGDQVPMYGYIVGITGSGTAYNNLDVGDILHYKNTDTQPWAATDLNSPQPYDALSNDLVRAQVIQTATQSSDKFFKLLVLPKYEGTKFSYRNELLKTIASNNNTYRRFRLVSGIWQANSLTGMSVTQVSITHFRTPDLRGRFALGFNQTAISENGIETDPTFISSIGTYAMGSLGGEELHTLTSNEMPSHTHTATSTSTSTANTTVTDPGHLHGTTGSAGHNAPASTTSPRGYEINDFAGTQYNVGTQRSTTGISVNVAVTTNTTTTNSAVGANTAHNNMPPYITVRYIIKAKPYTRAAIIDSIEIPYANLLIRDIRTQSIGGTPNADLIICTNRSNDGGLGTERIRITGSDGRVGIGKTPAAGVSLDVNGWAAFSGRVGIGKTDPQVALDIVGQVRSSIALADYETANAKTLTTKEYVDNTRSGIIIFDREIEIMNKTGAAATPTTRQILTVPDTAGVPSTAKYIILNVLSKHDGNTIYLTWMGKSTEVNTGHRIVWQTSYGGGDSVAWASQFIMPFAVVSGKPTLYWNATVNAGAATDLVISVAGYVS